MNQSENLKSLQEALNWLNGKPCRMAELEQRAKRARDAKDALLKNSLAETAAAHQALGMLVTGRLAKLTANVPKKMTAKEKRAQAKRVEDRAFIQKKDRPAVRSFFKKHTHGPKLNPRYDRTCAWLNGKLKRDEQGFTLPDPPTVGGVIKRWVVMDVVNGK